MSTEPNYDANELDLSNQNLYELPDLTKYAKLCTLNCSNNCLTSLGNLPNNLQSLNCSNNSLTSLGNLPNNIHILNCSNNSLTSLGNLPNKLHVLNCNKNKLNTYYNIPSSVIQFDCENNPINSTYGWNTKEMSKYHKIFGKNAKYMCQDDIIQTIENVWSPHNYSQTNWYFCFSKGGAILVSCVGQTNDIYSQVLCLIYHIPFSKEYTDMVQQLLFISSKYSLINNGNQNINNDVVVLKQLHDIFKNKQNLEDALTKQNHELADLRFELFECNECKNEYNKQKETISQILSNTVYELTHAKDMLEKSEKEKKELMCILTKCKIEMGKMYAIITKKKTETLSDNVSDVSDESDESDISDVSDDEGEDRVCYLLTGVVVLLSTILAFLFLSILILVVYYSVLYPSFDTQILLLNMV